MKYKIHYIILSGILLSCLSACNKTDFLNVRPNSSLVVPTSISNFQALLDIYYINETPALGETSSDNYYISNYTNFQAMQIKDQNTYIWSKDIFQGVGNNADWNEMYQNVLYANVILEGLTNLPRTASNSSDWDNMKGSALFTRAHQFYELTQVFAPAYDSAGAINDLGIPLKLSSDINNATIRSNVKDSYAQIINDLKAAIPLLSPVIPSANRNRPSRAAAYGLLARTYLSMRAYSQAYLYADSSLRIYNTLMDYNLNTVTGNTPFPVTNAEAVYQSNIYGNEQVLYTLRFQTSGYSVDTLLYKSYDANDLRKYFYFVPLSTGIFTKSGYTGNSFPFSGIATDEMYLTRAECQARLGNVSAALNDLNTLLVFRYKTGTYKNYGGLSAQQALTVILNERRKELVLRGLRWTDLRRLNKDGANITLTRVLNGQTYTLPPNSPLYTLPIPPDVIILSGIQQNNR